MTIKDDVLAVNYLMREPVTEHEVERVVHALLLASYELKKRAPEKGTTTPHRRAQSTTPQRQ